MRFYRTDHKHEDSDETTKYIMYRKHNINIKFDAERFFSL